MRAPGESVSSYPIHPSAWKGCSQKFEVTKGTVDRWLGLSELLRFCFPQVPFFFRRASDRKVPLLRNPSQVATTSVGGLRYAPGVQADERMKEGTGGRIETRQGR